MKSDTDNTKSATGTDSLDRIVRDLIQALAEIRDKTDEVLRERSLEGKWKDPTDLALFIERIGKIANKARHKATQVYIANAKGQPL